MVWQLCHQYTSSGNRPGTHPWLLASVLSLLQGISYQSIRSEDHTGTTKIQLHTATFRDPHQQQQAAAAAAAAASAAAAAAAAAAASKASYSGLPEYGAAAEAGGGGPRAPSPVDSSSLSAHVLGSHPRELSAPSHSSSNQQALEAAAAAAALAAAEAGLILAPWNPDESWEADELVRIYAIHGAMEARHVVYEHIEVLVHPIRVHLTAALAGALQDYFNLREEDGSSKDSKPATKLQEAAAARVAKQAGVLVDRCVVGSSRTTCVLQRYLSPSYLEYYRGAACVECCFHPPLLLIGWWSFFLLRLVCWN